MKSTDSKIVVRMAPSPTGNLHIGGVRTALFNFLFARQAGGKFILRIEDTDRERSKKEFEDNILESFAWLGLKYDELYRQSERGELYKQYLQKLIEDGGAYISQEPTTNNQQPTKELRDEVIRFKNPNKKIVFDDLIRGRVEFDTTDLGDFVIAKSIEEPLYHFAVVVDDFEMGVTHVIRGEEHLSNTPRHILIQEAIGATRPIYAHIPLILAPDRSKLSKRFGAVSAVEYKEQGYLPSGIINYLALLGWNPGTEQEIFTLDELITEFDIAKIQKGGAIFDEKKLRWVNKEHLKRLSLEEVSDVIGGKITKHFSVQNVSPKLVNVLRERIEIFSDVDELIKAGELDYFFGKPVLDKEKLIWKDTSKEDTKRHLEKVIELIGQGEKIFQYAEGEGKGAVLWPLRYALSGKEKSPDPLTLLDILGKEESLERVKVAIALLK